MTTFVKDQSRLIDHFKRVYSIIVGLALTEACKRFFTIDIANFHVSSLWMFLTLFVTIIPIFQGGDRFLDVEYFKKSLGPTAMRISFMWDVYMLLLTALIFVGVAVSVPPSSPTVVAPGTVPHPPHLLFFYGLAVLFAFDVFVLVVGWIKNAESEMRRNYGIWILSNVLMAVISLLAALQLDHWPAFATQATTAFVVLLCAIARTLTDYRVDRSVMFPDIEPVT